MVHVLHAYPLVVPEHEPERYWPPAQLAFEHVLHWYPLDAPEHEPLR